ncbi:hypothetical protein [Mangrovibacillus cuniculi]|uniref:Uncharacterized protein n=1 Tax=Mangrovibacillus cuniculi TaxID=2593652 RepID=A0A7S8HE81_9BACI|nr:hypothetical protein [Mangrovibacillus cuniculi]QPC45559.1 hypothetical protein G8O30_00490 [Mangrovibacillus cuniculi]
MIKKDLALSIVLHLFLAYLWILFVSHNIGLQNETGNMMYIAIVVVGTLLFGELVQRLKPLSEYKFTHPVRLAGLATFVSVVVVDLFLISLV